MRVHTDSLQVCPSIRERYDLPYHLLNKTIWRYLRLMYHWQHWLTAHFVVVVVVVMTVIVVVLVQVLHSSQSSSLYRGERERRCYARSHGRCSHEWCW